MRHYPAHTFLFHQGWQAKSVYFVESGIVKVFHTNEDGKESIIDLRGGGNAYGVAATLLAKPFQLSGMTLTDCQVWSVDSETFLSLLQTDAKFSLYIHQLQSQNYYKQMGIRFGSVRQRLENLLRQLILILGLDETEKNLRFRNPISQYDMAALIDTTYTYVSKILKQMEREGLLHKKNRWLTIFDPQTLCRMEVC